MQLHEQAPTSAMTLCFGVELLTILQVSLTLVLGYVASWVWMSHRQRPSKVVKVVEAEIEESAAASEDAAEACSSSLAGGMEDEAMPEEKPAAAEETAGSPSAKARRGNAQERRRQRKASSSLAESQDAENVIEEKQHCPPPPTHMVEEPAQVQTTEQDLALVSERVLKMKAKKAERKTRKLQVSEGAQQQAEEEEEQEVTASVPAVLFDKLDSDVNSQDGQADLSQTASTPSMLSGVDSSESEGGLCKMESDDASTPGSVHSQTIEEGAEGQIHEAPEEQMPLELDTAKDEVAETAEKANVVDRPEENQNTAAFSGAWADADDDDDTELPIDVVHVNFDDIVSDSGSEVSDGNMQEQVATPEELYLPESSNAPSMWCNLPQSPSHIDEVSPSHAMMPQMEGWVAVAVPTECAPPGPFDGLWKNTADERILIEKLEIMFESGVTWVMEMHSLTRLSVEVDGEKVYGDLDSSAGQLHWSDGDVWVFFGMAQDTVQPVVDVIPELPCQPCMMLPFAPEAMPLVDHMSMPSPNNQCIPTNAENWEICWDWKKKGWCPRGGQCEWYHPAPETSFFNEST
jgi:hypothetical protein